MALPPWMAAAWRQHGVREAPRASHTRAILNYAQAIGASWVKTDETPWCASFVGACLEAADVASTRSMRARSYQSWGRDVRDAPPVGAIVVLSRGRNPAYGHVGFFLSRSSKGIVLLGGNQGNAVSVDTYSTSRVVAIRWPKEVDLPEVGSNAPEFREALDFILAQEGGWTDDPHDPGGPTNKGITLGVYADEVRRKITSSNRADLIAQLRTLDEQRIREIYHRRYWKVAQAHNLPTGLATFHFDCAVNQGPGRAARFLQASVGASVDGAIGPLTLSAAHRADAVKALQKYAGLRRRHYRGLSHFWRFGRGWLARVERTLAASLAQARSAPSVDPLVVRSPSQVDDADQKAERASDLVEARATKPSREASANGAKTPTSQGEQKLEAKKNMAEAPKWWAESITIWGTIVTGMSTILPLIGPFVGLDVSAEMIDAFGAQVAQLLQVIGGLIGMAMTVYGRLRATRPLVQRAMTVDLRL